MNHDHGLSARTVEAIHSVFARHDEIEEAILFGSRAKGNYKAGSDIDLVLKGEGMTHCILSLIATDLDDLPIPYEFSLVLDRELAGPEIRAHVQRVGRMFYERRVATGGGR